MRLMRGPHRSRRRPAVAAMEAAMLLPLLVGLMLGLWELGRLSQLFQTVSNAAREGSRQAASAKYTKSEVRQAVFDYLKNANVRLHDTVPQSSVTLANTNATITVSNLTTGGEVFDAAQLNQVQVSVQVPIKNSRLLLSNSFMPESSSVSCTFSFLCTRDVPISIDVDIPQQPLPAS